MHISSLCSEPRNRVIRLVPETDQIVAVCLEGDFDMASAQELGDQIDRTLDSGNDVVVDFDGATFIDSCIIHVVVRASKRASDRGRILVLQLESPALVERALEIAGIEHVLPRAHDRLEAVRLIRDRMATTT